MNATSLPPANDSAQRAFAELALQPELLANLSTLGYHTMTPIQAASLPEMLGGKDVIGQGKTGSGKTAAFGLALLNKLNVKKFRVQCLVICPTRELADQVAVEIRRLARAVHNIKVLTICGGASIGPQIGSLEHGAHIVVGTPGRIQDHLRKNTLKLQDVNTLVLDEADRMLDMGFQESLDAIIENIPQQRQTLLFSATFPREIERIASRIMREPTRIEIDGQHSDEIIEQHFYKVADEAARDLAIRTLLLHHQPVSALVFCTTKKETQALAETLQADGFAAMALHGDLDQKERDQTLLRFANNSLTVLVATDVAARGLDIDALGLVINYRPSRDPEVHVHRVGRTGRAGSSGCACTLFSGRESQQIAVLQERLQRDLSAERLPDERSLPRDVPGPAMLTLQIDGGKKQKLRAGDILGALTRGDEAVAGDTTATIAGSDVGKINLYDTRAFVAVRRSVVKQALQKIQRGKMKGRNFKVRLLE